MALIPLNKFLTKTRRVSDGVTSTSTAYVSPVGVTSIVLMAQIANLGTQTETVSFSHYRERTVLADAQGNGRQEGRIETFLVRDFQIPANDALNPISGKLIIETLDSVRCIGSNTTTLQLTLSILETANE